MGHIIAVTFALIALKSIFIGSEFSFVYWMKYGKLYTDWYFSKETFKDYLINKESKQ